MKYIISQIKFAFEIKGFPTQRIEIPEYPLETIRETAFNTVIHRILLPHDIQIEIFNKKITIYNHGKMSGNLTFEDLKTDNYQAYAKKQTACRSILPYGRYRKIRQRFSPHQGTH
jgi:ATP-dependent DNA helicase RecG